MDRLRGKIDEERCLLVWGEVDDRGSIAWTLKVIDASLHDGVWGKLVGIGRVGGCVYYWDGISCLKGLRLNARKSIRVSFASGGL